MWSDNMQMALFAIRGNKLRSFLTMLGIVIGIGSVIAILSIGDTMKMAFEALYEGEGATRAMLYVVPGKAIEPDVFTLDDLETVRRVFDESIAYLDSYATLTAQASHLAGSGKKREAQLYLQGIDGDYGEAMPLDIVDGRSLREGDVLGRYAHLVL
ncbi:MAG: ABC transporter permease, partial [Lachnospiraceae bacterium]|nr:ABC transporter permease [Lachnospiraceae bacterium]